MARRGGNAADLQSTLMDHVKELRNRAIIVALALIVGSVLAYTNRVELFNILLAPLEGQKLISYTPGGSLTFIMNLSIFSGFAVAMPFLIYHLYGFLQPMMPEKMRRNAIKMFFFSMFLLAGGIAFAYYLALPGAMRFLFEFSDGFIDMSQLSADSYLSFFIKYLIGLGVIFQTPLVLLIIHWVRPLTPGGLMKSQRWVIVISFIVAAVITPTQDPYNLMVVALPTIAVYQIGVGIIIYGVYRDRRLEKLARIRAQKKDLAAVRKAVAERRSLQAGHVHPIPAASLAPPRAAVSQPSAAVVLPAPVARVRMVDGFAAPKSTAPSVAPIVVEPVVTAPRPQELSIARPADRTTQPYRTRKTIDGFARRPAVIIPQPVVAQPVTQTMVQSYPNGQHLRMSVDGISSVAAA